MDATLKHHGILGMKWGVRRTPAQLGYKTGDKDEKKKAAASSGGKDSVGVSLGKGGKSDSEDGASKGAAGKGVKKDFSSLTDDEIRQKLNRARLEEDYGKLLDKQNAKPESKVKRLLGDALENFGRQLFNQAASNLAQRVGGDLFKKKEGAFDSSMFEFADTSKVSAKKLQEAVQWYSLNTRYATARDAYKDGNKTK